MNIERLAGPDCAHVVCLGLIGSGTVYVCVCDDGSRADLIVVRDGAVVERLPMLLVRGGGVYAMPPLKNPTGFSVGRN